jgi:hypothetical protein
MFASIMAKLRGWGVLVFQLALHNWRIHAHVHSAPVGGRPMHYIAQMRRACGVARFDFIIDSGVGVGPWSGPNLERGA